MLFVGRQNNEIKQMMCSSLAVAAPAWVLLSNMSVCDAQSLCQSPPSFWYALALALPFLGQCAASIWISPGPID